MILYSGDTTVSNKASGKKRKLPVGWAPLPVHDREKNGQEWPSYDPDQFLLMIISLRASSSKADDSFDPVKDGCDSAGCESRGCDSACLDEFQATCRKPLWTATADALFLTRRDPAGGIIAFNTITPSEQIRGEDFHFGNHAGYDLSLQRQLGSVAALELRYFGVDSWNAGVSGATTPNQLLQINAAAPVFAISGDGITANLQSKLHNGEVNLKHNVGDSFRLLTGFRYLELDERFGANLVGAAVPLSYAASTTNRLYGAQIGAEAALLQRQRATLDLFCKAGVFGNHSSHQASINTNVVSLNANGSGSPTAFVGETGILGGLRLADNVALRGGYRLLWVDRIATARDQLAATDFFAGTGYNGSGEAFYHGAVVGLEVTW